MSIQFNQQFQQQKKRRSRIKIYLISGATALLVIFTVYLIIFSSIFKIKEIRINGSEKLTKEEILKNLEPFILKDRISAFLGLENLLAWNQKGVVFPGALLREAKIERKWLRQALILNIRERERVAIWCGAAEQCYWIDQDGLIFDEAPQTEGPLLLTVKNPDIILIKGTKISEERFIKNIIAILKGISDFNLSIKEIYLNSYLQEIKISTYGGFSLLFSIRFNPELNLASFQKLGEKINLQNLKYLDLRVENRIYYKL